MPVGADFSIANVVDLEKLLPDCGYLLRSVEVEATGRLARVDCEDCPEGKATVLNVTGGGIQLELTGVDEWPPYPVRLVGLVSAPFDGHLSADVLEIEPLSAVQ